MFTRLEGEWILHTLFFGDIARYWQRRSVNYEDEYTLAMNEKANEREKKRWRTLRHLSGQRPAAVRETSDMKIRAAQPPADLSHRSRWSPSDSPLYEISISLHFPCQLFSVYSIVSICSMPPSLFYDFPLYILILFSVSLLHTTLTVFLPLQISTQASLMRCDVVRADIERAAADLSIGTKF